MLSEQIFKNAVVDEGVAYLENVAFNGSGVQAQIATWYLGLVNNSGFTQFLPADSAAQIGGTNQWSEMAGYSGTNRIVWASGSSVSRAVSNATTADFVMTASNSVKGIFLTSFITRAGTSGIIFATAAFPSVAPVINGDTLKISYTISA